MQYEVGTKTDRLLHSRCGKTVVHHQHYIFLFTNGRYFFEVNDIETGIGRRLEVYHFGFICNERSNIIRPAHIKITMADAPFGKIFGKNSMGGSKYGRG
ncbi:hypothetical protein D9M69_706620 [compost metagenome]